MVAFLQFISFPHLTHAFTTWCLPSLLYARISHFTYYPRQLRRTWLWLLETHISCGCCLMHHSATWRQLTPYCRAYAADVDVFHPSFPVSRFPFHHSYLPPPLHLFSNNFPFFLRSLSLPCFASLYPPCLCVGGLYLLKWFFSLTTSLSSLGIFWCLVRFLARVFL